MFKGGIFLVAFSLCGHVLKYKLIDLQILFERYFSEKRILKV
ncbi:hypothetical protein NC99_28990 [Sunxiuqinia dokdonensis]|uniref:Uncharacterized protein n=1 Tax=Sunxiuqinia dokdonensis TaxID=1409788 RepID=A0A0L8V763_9BACT|nr:hypothetical protein NC99_28990 [Sunxiuqinia dokdonensis]